MHRLQPRKNASKNRMFLVEPRSRICCNEELGSVRVRTCVRHTHGIRPIMKKKMVRIKYETQAVKKNKKIERSSTSTSTNIPIMLQLIRELIFKFAIPDARPARAIAERVARLDHELDYYAMEEHAIVVSTPRMPDEVFHRLGSLLREKTQVHVSQCCMDRSGGRERGRTRRCGGWRRCCDRLLFPCRTLIEDVPVTGFRTAISITRRGRSVRVKADMEEQAGDDRGRTQAHYA